MIVIILLVLLLLLFPFGQLERIPLNNPQVGLYLHDLIIVILVGYWLIEKIVKKEKFRTGNLAWPILLFLLTAFLSFLVNSFTKKFDEITIGFLYLWRWAAYAGIYFVIKDKKIVKLFNGSIVEWLILTGVISANFGLIQYIFFPDIRPLTVWQWDPHYYRVVGTYLEPGFTGLIFVLTMILIVGKNWTNWSNWIDWLLLVVCYAAFALTYSRSSYLAYLAGMGLIAYFKRSLKFFLVVLGIFIFTLLILPRPGGEGVKLERQASLWSRLQSWRQGFLIFKGKPILGVGFNFYRYAAGNNALSHAGAGVDNSFIFVLATTGIVGLFFYGRLFYKIIKNEASHKTEIEDLSVSSASFLPRINAGCENKPLSLPILASLIVLMVHSLFNNSLFYSWAMIWFWFLLAV